MNKLFAKSNSSIVIDSKPDDFTIPTFTNCEPDTYYYFTVTPTGFDGTIKYKIYRSGWGRWTGCKDGINYTFVGNNIEYDITIGETIYFRIYTEPTLFNAVGTYTLTIGSNNNAVSAVGTITTRSADTYPEYFEIPTVFNAELSSLITFDIIYVYGMEPNCLVLVSTTDGDFDAQASNLTGNYSSTTRNITTSSGGGFLVRTRAYSASTYSTVKQFLFTVGGRSIYVTSKTKDPDLTPDTITFTNLINCELNSEQYSEEVTVTGLSSSVNVNIQVGSVGNYNAGTSSLTTGWSVYSHTITTSSSGTFQLQLKMGTTGSAFNTTRTVDVYVNNVIVTQWSTTTRGPDLIPNSFNFPSKTGQQLNTAVTSDIITISGLEPNYSHSISISSGTIDGGTSSLSGTFASSKTITSSATGTLVVAAKVTSSSSFFTQVLTTITINSTSANFSVTTRAADTTPETFGFTDISNAEPNITYTSNTVTVSGLEPNYNINISSNKTVDAGTSSLSGTFESSKSVTTSGTGTLVVAARVTSPGFSSSTSNTVTVGTMSDTYYVYTRLPDTTPNSFSFTTQTGKERSTSYTSNTVTVSGLEPNYNISISASGGTVDAGTSSLSGTFATSKSVTTSGTGTLVVAARVTSSSSFSTSVSTTITIGSGSATFTVTTRAADLTGSIGTFTATTGATKNIQYWSNSATVSGLEPNYTVSFSAPTSGVRCGTTSASSSVAWNGATCSCTTSASGTCVVQLTIWSAKTANTAKTATVSLVGGSASGSWTLTTGA